MGSLQLFYVAVDGQLMTRAVGEGFVAGTESAIATVGPSGPPTAFNVPSSTTTVVLCPQATPAGVQALTSTSGSSWSQQSTGAGTASRISMVEAPDTGGMMLGLYRGGPLTGQPLGPIVEQYSTGGVTFPATRTRSCSLPPRPPTTRRRFPA
jgi:hypothetical protein